jgi:hypothetical protein
VDVSEDLKRRIAALLPAKAAKGAPGTRDHPGKDLILHRRRAQTLGNPK